MEKGTATRALARSLIIVFAFLLSAGKLFGEIFIYDSHGKRDPFLPAEEAVEETVQESSPAEQVIDTREFEEWFGKNLGGIIWDSETPYALIGDDIVGIGDERRGCTIVEIKPGSIVFQYKTKRVEVPLREMLEETGADDY